MNKNITKWELGPLHWEKGSSIFVRSALDRVKNGMWLRIGDVRNEGEPTYITFWSNLKHSQHHDYRHTQSDEDKDSDWLKEYVESGFNFNAIRNGEQISTDKIVKFYQE
ncbi:MAG: hypothetical protein LBD91_02140 [Prevotellaceae bacterium]|nr:hypothetical protein [Prevotellaceae bacterium]